MKWNLNNGAKVAVVLAVVGGFLASITNVSCAAKEWFGPHSGFHGSGGLGRAGYRFGDRFEDNHPRRSEVLARDNRLNWTLNKDRGHLGGNYGSLEKQQIAIRRQEQADARANGGYITTAQKAQLNQEENQLRSQIRKDYTK